MTRDINGAHLPNGRYYHIEQMLRAVGERGAITCLHVQLFNDPLLGSHSDDENENWYLKLREGFAPQGIPPAPERLIHVRCYHPFSLSVDPRGYAEHIVSLLSNWKGSRTTEGQRRNLWDDPFVCVSSSNELNLHHENGDPNPANQWMYQTVDHYTRLAEWDIAFWQRVDELVPGRKALRCSPAFADGHEPPGLPPDAEYTVPAVRRMLAESDIIACHPYALLNRPNDPNRPPQGIDTVPGGVDEYWYMLRPFRPKGHKDRTDPGGMLAQIPGKPFLISESGTFTHSWKDRTEETWAAMRALLSIAARSGRCLGVTWFIWNSDGAHKDNEIWPNEDLRGLLEHADRFRTTAAVPVRGATPPAPPPSPQPEPPMPFQATDRLSALLAAEFGDGFEDVRTRLPDGDYGLGNYPRRPVEAITEIAIHHTATVSTVTVETIHRHHTANNHWGGTGYTVFIDGAARVYLTGTLETVRAHVGGTDPETGQGWNYKTVGVCLAGSFMEYQPTIEQRDAARRVLACLHQVIGNKPYRGHMEFRGAPSTACPGSTWWEWVDDLAPRSAPAPTVQWAKVVWALEEATRILEREALTAEAQTVADNYTMDAIIKRDGQ